jgi:hypothetical protein
VPGTAVDRFTERPASGASGTAGRQVRCRRPRGAHGAWRPAPEDRDQPDRPVRPVLESALFMAGAAVGPCGGGPGRGRGEPEHAPSGAREVAVGVAQGDGFLRAEAGVVQAAKEGSHLRPGPDDRL